MTLMDKINAFESLPVSTVAKFNEIFAVKLMGVDPTLEVEIGELYSSDTTRILMVGGLKVIHDFTPRRGDDKERKDERNEVSSWG